MKPSGLVVFVIICLSALRAEDATRSIDPARRNAPFTPPGSIQPAKRTPLIDETLQQKRVAPPAIDLPRAILRDRRAVIDVAETTTKRMHENDTRPLKIVRPPKSRLEQQRAHYSITTGRAQPPLVGKYQASLAAATANNMARFPAVSGATKPKINRFVFRKNAGDSVGAPQRATVTPAAGGSVIRK